MNIESTVRVTTINQQNKLQMQKLVLGKAQIAWSEDIDKEIPLTGVKQTFGLTNTPYLRTFSLGKIDPIETNRKLRKEYLDLGKTGCKLAK